MKPQKLGNERRHSRGTGLIDKLEQIIQALLTRALHAGPPPLMATAAPTLQGCSLARTPLYGALPQLPAAPMWAATPSLDTPPWS